jgi:hypothetical protein
MTNLALSLLLFAFACGESDPAAPVAEAPATAQLPADAAAPAEAPAQASADAPAAQRLLGEWTIVLGPQELRQVELLKLALKDPPPTVEELTKANLTAEEKAMVDVMGSARAANPSDPKIAEMKSAADGLATATVTFTADSMEFRAGPISETSAYSVVSQTESTVVVRSTGPANPDGSPGQAEDATITFDGPDAILLADAADPGNSQRFTRKR